MYFKQQIAKFEIITNTVFSLTVLFKRHDY